MSASDASVSRQGSEHRGSPNRTTNRPYDEALDVSASQSMSDAKTPGSRRGGGGGGGSGGAKGEGGVANQPFDEAHSLGSDGDLSSEDSVMTNDSAEMSPQPKSSAAADRPAAKAALESVARDRTAASITAAPLSTVPTPSPAAAAQLKSSASSGARGSGAGAGTNAAASESESDESDDDDDDESRAGAPVAGAYNPADYKHLPVNAEIKDLFQYISRYKPHEVELDSTLKCFIPDFIPAVGEMDAFIKVPPPDSSRDELGLKVLDEPAAQQSDATVLELQLRAGSKKVHGDLSIRSIENAAKNPQEVERWIRSIQDLHKQKHSVEVQYKRNMPDLDSLMQEWPGEFEEALQQMQLPTAQLDMSTEEYARVMCAVLDVPVYDNLSKSTFVRVIGVCHHHVVLLTRVSLCLRTHDTALVVESLHVIFSLYMAFKDNPHFQARQKEGGEGEGYSGGEGGFGAGEGKNADVMEFGGGSNNVMMFDGEGKM